MIAEPHCNGHVPNPDRLPADPARLGVAEWALLILATVFGLVADWALRSRGITPNLAGLLTVRDAVRTGPTMVGFARDAALSLVPLGLAWTLATLATLDGAVRPFGRLARRPGLTPALVIGPALVAAALLTWNDVGLPPRGGGWPAAILSARLHVIDAMAAGVAFGWLVLVRGRRWEPGPGWADRVGLGLGLFWIIAAVLIHAPGVIRR